VLHDGDQSVFIDGGVANLDATALDVGAATREQCGFEIPHHAEQHAAEDAAGSQIKRLTQIHVYIKQRLNVRGSSIAFVQL
jgi:hypothetical protein